MLVPIRCRMFSLIHKFILMRLIDLVDFFHNKSNKYLHTLADKFKYMLSRVPIRIPHQIYSAILCDNVVSLHPMIHFLR